ncbi:spore germination protein KA [Paenibacillus catalpae]|uniref:Spore germination protein KA n=1 Tax=Paenibacillus catalpae TaxID=1045775 RepID=A0A1I1U2N0_9BACL|nr:spore germination protein [Paenibacillus catalpae]SFD64964.1 spore germination protein KA [Paenibacillus catalpae]
MKTIGGIGLFRIKHRKNSSKQLESSDLHLSDEHNSELSMELALNEKLLSEKFQASSDIIFRPISSSPKVLLIYVDGLIDTKTLDQVVIMPILYDGASNGRDQVPVSRHVIEEQLIAVAQVQTGLTINDAVNGILKGNVLLLVDGENKAIIAELKGFEARTVEEPAAEVSIRGPRDGFTETLRVNTSLIRRRIRSPKLKMESTTVGQVSQTDIVIAYIEGIVSNTVLEEVRNRIGQIRIDGVLESGYVEEFIEDVPWSPFPQIQNTERPDIVSASLLEGKVAILVDNTPFVLIVPMTFWTGLQAVEDYYERSIYTTFVRFVRFSLFNIALLLPSMYVALSTFHQQLIPTNLLISIANSREGVPFPTFVETLLMEFMFEGLREAGIRMPKAVGSAVSIVGALVIGQAAVQAGIVSAPVVIVVATTGIASFAIPRYNFGTAYRLLRFPMLFLAGILGLYGIISGLFLMIIHLLRLQSFGVPYMNPVVPLGQNLKDVFIRAPRWSMNMRPEFSGPNKKRIPEGQQPSSKRGGQSND